MTKINLSLRTTFHRAFFHTNILLFVFCSSCWNKWSEKKWSRSVMSDSLRPHGLQPTRLLSLWDFPGKSTGVGCHFILQRIFPTQGWNLGLQHCRQTLYCLSYQGNINQKIWNSEKLRHLLKVSYWLASDVSTSYNTGDPGLMPWLGRSPGEGNSSRLQYSCLENPMDRGAWQATVLGVARVRQDLTAKPPVMWTRVNKKLPVSCLSSSPISQ